MSASYAKGLSLVETGFFASICWELVKKRVEGEEDRGLNMY